MGVAEGDRAPEVLRLPCARGREVTVVAAGAGRPVVFLHSGVGSAGEWKQVFARWPPNYRLLAIDVHRSASVIDNLDDCAEQVFAVAGEVGAPLWLIGFSWGGATALRVATVAPDLVDALSLIEPEAYAMLGADAGATQDRADGDAYRQICALRDEWRVQVRAGRWDAAFEACIDFYNGPGSFAAWPAARRESFLAAQQARGDLWDVLFDTQRLDLASLARVTATIHLIEGSASSAVDHAICGVLRRHLPHARHTVIPGAGHMMPLTHAVPLTQALLAGTEG